MTHCADAARRPDEQRLDDVASILAAGILRLRERQSLPIADITSNPRRALCQALRGPSARPSLDQFLEIFAPGHERLLLRECQKRITRSASRVRNHVWRSN